MDLPGEELAAVFQGGDSGLLQAAAAGDLHPDHGQALDGVVPEDGGELFGVVHGVQLGAADEDGFSPEEFPVEVAVGVGSAVGGDEKVGVFKNRGR